MLIPFSRRGRNRKAVRAERNAFRPGVESCEGRQLMTGGVSLPLDALSSASGVDVGGRQAIFYLRTTGELREIVAGTDVSYTSGVAALAGGTDQYGRQAVYYLGTNGDLREIYSGADVYYAGGIKQVAAGSDVYGQPAVYYLSTGGDLRKIAGRADGYYVGGITSLVGGPDQYGRQAVYYLSTGGDLREVYSGADVYYVGGIKRIAAGSDVYGQPAVYYLSTGGDLRKIAGRADGYYTGGVADLAAGGDAQGRPAVYYLGTNGDLHEVYSGADGYYIGGVTALAAGTDYFGQPAVYYLRSNGDLQKVAAHADGYYTGSIKALVAGTDYSGQPAVYYLSTAGELRKIAERGDSYYVGGISDLAAGTDFYGQPAVYYLGTNGDLRKIAGHGDGYYTGGVRELAAGSDVYGQPAVYYLAAAGGLRKIAGHGDSYFGDTFHMGTLTITLGADHVLYLQGTSGDDVIRLRQDATTLRVDGLPITFDTGSVSKVSIQGLAGNDTIDALWLSFAPVTVPVAIDGGPGNDTLCGGMNDDALSGGDGNDVLRGYSGSDRLDGGEGDDFLDGGYGTDAIAVNAGNDTAAFQTVSGQTVTMDVPAMVRRYLELGGEGGILGLPTGQNFAISARRPGWWGKEFQNGSIYTDGAGAIAVYGKTWVKYLEFGREYDILGAPMGNPVDYGSRRPGWWGQEFQNGSIYTDGTVAIALCDRAWDKYKELGRESGGLGLPLDEGTVLGAARPGWGGVRFQNGVIDTNGVESESFIGQVRRPTLVVVSHGFWLSRGGEDAEKQWTTDLAGQIRDALQAAGSETVAWITSWTSNLLAVDNPSDSMAQQIRAFLDGKNETWDLVLVGHSRGGVLNNEIANKVGLHPRLGKITEIMLDPTAVPLMGDRFPSDVRGDARAIDYDDGYALAPGVIDGPLLSGPAPLHEVRNIHDVIRQDLDNNVQGSAATSVSAVNTLLEGLKIVGGADYTPAGTILQAAWAVGEPIAYHVAVPIWYMHSSDFTSDMNEIIQAKTARDVPLVPHSSGPEVRQTPGGTFGPRPNDVANFLVDLGRYLDSLRIQGVQNIVDGGLGLARTAVQAWLPGDQADLDNLNNLQRKFDQWCAYAREYDDWAYDKLENWVYNDVAPFVNQTGEAISDWYHKKILGH